MQAGDALPVELPKCEFKGGPPNQDEWRCWVADHAPKLLLFARQTARSEGDAEDLVQELQMQCFWRALCMVLFSALMPRHTSAAPGRRRMKLRCNGLR